MFLSSCMPLKLEIFRSLHSLSLTAMEIVARGSLKNKVFTTHAVVNFEP